MLTDAIWEEALAEGQGSFDNFGPMFGSQLNEEMMAQQMAGVSELAAKPKYQLPLENKYRGQRELFQRGMQFFNNGEIKEAIEVFQAFVEGETEDPSEGWRMLGCHIKSTMRTVRLFFAWSVQWRKTRTIWMHCWL